MQVDPDLFVGESERERVYVNDLRSKKRGKKKSTINSKWPINRVYVFADPDYSLIFKFKSTRGNTKVLYAGDVKVREKS